MPRGKLTELRGRAPERRPSPIAGSPRIGAIWAATLVFAGLFVIPPTIGQTTSAGEGIGAVREDIRTYDAAHKRCLKEASGQTYSPVEPHSCIGQYKIKYGGWYDGAKKRNECRDLLQSKYCARIAVRDLQRECNE